MFTGILWRFLLLETFVLGAFCSVCFNEHPQKQFCNSEFAKCRRCSLTLLICLALFLRMVMVKFHEAKKMPGLKMEIKKVFKGNIEELSLRDNRYLNKDVVKQFKFKAGKKYYLFGRNIHGRIYFEMCNGVLPLEYTTLAQRRGLLTSYEASCECSDEIGNYVKRSQWLFSIMYKYGNQCVPLHKEVTMSVAGVLIGGAGSRVDLPLPDEEALNRHLGCTDEEGCRMNRSKRYDTPSLRNRWR